MQALIFLLTLVVPVCFLAAASENDHNSIDIQPENVTSHTVVHDGTLDMKGSMMSTDLQLAIDPTVSTKPEASDEQVSMPISQTTTLSDVAMDFNDDGSGFATTESQSSITRVNTVDTITKNDITLSELNSGVRGEIRPTATVNELSTSGHIYMHATVETDLFATATEKPSLLMYSTNRSTDMNLSQIKPQATSTTTKHLNIDNVSTDALTSTFKVKSTTNYQSQATTVEARSTQSTSFNEFRSHPLHMVSAEHLSSVEPKATLKTGKSSTTLPPAFFNVLTTTLVSPTTTRAYTTTINPTASTKSQDSNKQFSTVGYSLHAPSESHTDNESSSIQHATVTSVLLASPLSTDFHSLMGPNPVSTNGQLPILISQTVNPSDVAMELRNKARSMFESQSVFNTADGVTQNDAVTASIPSQFLSKHAIESTLTPSKSKRPHLLTTVERSIQVITTLPALKSTLRRQTTETLGTTISPDLDSQKSVISMKPPDTKYDSTPKPLSATNTASVFPSFLHDNLSPTTTNAWTTVIRSTNQNTVPISSEFKLIMETSMSLPVVSEQLLPTLTEFTQSSKDAYTSNTAKRTTDSRFISPVFPSSVSEKQRNITITPTNIFSPSLIIKATANDILIEPTKASMSKESTSNVHPDIPSSNSEGLHATEQVVFVSKDVLPTRSLTVSMGRESQTTEILKMQSLFESETLSLYFLEPSSISPSHITTSHSIRSTNYLLFVVSPSVDTVNSTNPLQSTKLQFTSMSHTIESLINTIASLTTANQLSMSISGGNLPGVSSESTKTQSEEIPTSTYSAARAGTTHTSIAQIMGSESFPPEDNPITNIRPSPTASTQTNTFLSNFGTQTDVVTTSIEMEKITLTARMNRTATKMEQDLAFTSSIKVEKVETTSTINDSTVTSSQAQISSSSIMNNIQVSSSESDPITTESVPVLATSLVVPMLSVISENSTPRSTEAVQSTFPTGKKMASNLMPARSTMLEEVPTATPIPTGYGSNSQSRVHSSPSLTLTYIDNISASTGRETSQIKKVSSNFQELESTIETSLRVKASPSLTKVNMSATIDTSTIEGIPEPPISTKNYNIKEISTAEDMPIATLNVVAPSVMDPHDMAISMTVETDSSSSRINSDSTSVITPSLTARFVTSLETTTHLPSINLGESQHLAPQSFHSSMRSGLYNTKYPGSSDNQNFPSGAITEAVSKTFDPSSTLAIQSAKEMATSEEILSAPTNEVLRPTLLVTPHPSILIQSNYVSKAFTPKSHSTTRLPIAPSMSFKSNGLTGSDMLETASRIGYYSAEKPTSSREFSTNELSSIISEILSTTEAIHEEVVTDIQHSTTLAESLVVISVMDLELKSTVLDRSGHVNSTVSFVKEVIPMTVTTLQPSITTALSHSQSGAQLSYTSIEHSPISNTYASHVVESTSTISTRIKSGSLSIQTTIIDSSAGTMIPESYTKRREHVATTELLQLYATKFSLTSSSLERSLHNEDVSTSTKEHIVTTELIITPSTTLESQNTGSVDFQTISTTNTHDSSTVPLNFVSPIATMDPETKTNSINPVTQATNAMSADASLTTSDVLLTPSSAELFMTELVTSTESVMLQTSEHDLLPPVRGSTTETKLPSITTEGLQAQFTVKTLLSIFLATTVTREPSSMQFMPNSTQASVDFEYTIAHIPTSTSELYPTTLSIAGSQDTAESSLTKASDLPSSATERTVLMTTVIKTPPSAIADPKDTEITSSVTTTSPTELPHPTSVQSPAISDSDTLKITLVKASSELTSNMDFKEPVSTAKPDDTKLFTHTQSNSMSVFHTEQQSEQEQSESFMATETIPIGTVALSGSVMAPKVTERLSTLTSRTTTASAMTPSTAVEEPYQTSVQSQTKSESGNPTIIVMQTSTAITVTDESASSRPTSTSVHFTPLLSPKTSQTPTELLKSRTSSNVMTLLPRVIETPISATTDQSNAASIASLTSSTELPHPTSVQVPLITESEVSSSNKIQTLAEDYSTMVLNATDLHTKVATQTALVSQISSSASKDTLNATSDNEFSSKILQNSAYSSSFVTKTFSNRLISTSVELPVNLLTAPIPTKSVTLNEYSAYETAEHPTSTSLSTTFSLDSKYFGKSLTLTNIPNFTKIESSMEVQLTTNFEMPSTRDISTTIKSSITRPCLTFVPSQTKETFTRLKSMKEHVTITELLPSYTILTSSSLEHTLLIVKGSTLAKQQKVVTPSLTSDSQTIITSVSSVSSTISMTEIYSSFTEPQKNMSTMAQAIYVTSNAEIPSIISSKSVTPLKANSILDTTPTTAMAAEPSHSIASTSTSPMSVMFVTESPTNFMRPKTTVSQLTDEASQVSTMPVPDFTSKSANSVSTHEATPPSHTIVSISTSPMSVMFITESPTNLVRPKTTVSQLTDEASQVSTMPVPDFTTKSANSVSTHETTPTTAMAEEPSHTIASTSTSPMSVMFITDSPTNFVRPNTTVSQLTDETSQISTMPVPDFTTKSANSVSTYDTTPTTAMAAEPSHTIASTESLTNFVRPNTTVSQLTDEASQASTMPVPDFTTKSPNSISTHGTMSTMVYHSTPTRKENQSIFPSVTQGIPTPKSPTPLGTVTLLHPTVTEYITLESETVKGTNRTGILHPTVTMKSLDTTGYLTDTIQQGTSKSQNIIEASLLTNFIDVSSVSIPTLPHSVSVQATDYPTSTTLSDIPYTPDLENPTDVAPTASHVTLTPSASQISMTASVASLESATISKSEYDVLPSSQLSLTEIKLSSITSTTTINEPSNIQFTLNSTTSVESEYTVEPTGTSKLYSVTLSVAGSQNVSQLLATKSSQTNDYLSSTAKSSEVPYQTKSESENPNIISFQTSTAITASEEPASSRPTSMAVHFTPISLPKISDSETKLLQSKTSSRSDLLPGVTISLQPGVITAIPSTSKMMDMYAMSIASENFVAPTAIHSSVPFGYTSTVEHATDFTIEFVSKTAVESFSTSTVQSVVNSLTSTSFELKISMEVFATTLRVLDNQYHTSSISVTNLPTKVEPTTVPVSLISSSVTEDTLNATPDNVFFSTVMPQQNSTYSLTTFDHLAHTMYPERFTQSESMREHIATTELLPSYSTKISPSSILEHSLQNVKGSTSTKEHYSTIEEVFITPSIILKPQNILTSVDLSFVSLTTSSELQNVMPSITTMPQKINTKSTNAVTQASNTVANLFSTIGSQSIIATRVPYVTEITPTTSRGAKPTDAIVSTTALPKMPVVFITETPTNFVTLTPAVSQQSTHVDSLITTKPVANTVTTSANFVINTQNTISTMTPPVTYINTTFNQSMLPSLTQGTLILKSTTPMNTEMSVHPTVTKNTTTAKLESETLKMINPTGILQPMLTSASLATTKYFTITKLLGKTESQNSIEASIVTNFIKASSVPTRALPHSVSVTDDLPAATKSHISHTSDMVGPTDASKLPTASDKLLTPSTTFTDPIYSFSTITSSTAEVPYQTSVQSISDPTIVQSTTKSESVSPTVIDLQTLTAITTSDEPASSRPTTTADLFTPQSIRTSLSETELLQSRTSTTKFESVSPTVIDLQTLTVITTSDESASSRPTTMTDIFTPLSSSVRTSLSETELLQSRTFSQSILFPEVIETPTTLHPEIIISTQSTYKNMNVFTLFTASNDSTDRTVIQTKQPSLPFGYNSTVEHVADSTAQYASNTMMEIFPTSTVQSVVNTVRFDTNITMDMLTTTTTVAVTDKLYHTSPISVPVLYTKVEPSTVLMSQTSSSKAKDTLNSTTNSVFFSTKMTHSITTTLIPTENVTAQLNTKDVTTIAKSSITRPFLTLSPLQTMEESGLTNNAVTPPTLTGTITVYSENTEPSTNSFISYTSTSTTKLDSAGQTVRVKSAKSMIVPTPVTLTIPPSMTTDTTVIHGDNRFITMATMASTNIISTLPPTSLGKLTCQQDTGCSELRQDFDMLTNTSEMLTNKSLYEVAERLNILVKQSLDRDTEQIDENLNDISSTLVNIASYVNKSNVVINKTAVENVVETLSSLVQWTPTAVSSDTSSKILESFEMLISQYAQQIPLNMAVNFTAPTVTLTAEKVQVQTFKTVGRNLAFNSSGKIVRENVKFGQLLPGQDAAISLPPSLFNIFNITDLSNVSMFFGFYENATLFPVGKESSKNSETSETTVCSPVLAATVAQRSIQDLSSDASITVIFRLQHLFEMSAIPGSERCVSWDFQLQDWNQRGCTSSKSDQIVICTCSHLTNFAVLVDVCTLPEGCGTSTESPTTSVSNELDEINNSFTNLTSETVGIAVSNLSNIIERTEESETDQTEEVLGQVSDYFSSLATFFDTSNVLVNTSVIGDVIQVVSSLVHWEPENVKADSSSNVVESFEKVVSLYAQQIPVNETQNFSLPLLTVVVERRTFESLSIDGRSFKINSEETLTGPEGVVRSSQLSSNHHAAVDLPSSLFKQIDNHTHVGIFFMLYETATLFPVDSVTNNQSKISSRVLSVTVGSGLRFIDLEHNVTILLRQTPINSTVSASERCVSWDFDLQDWTTQDCTTIVGQNETIICNCNHLTNFAILVDICSRQEDCAPSEVDPFLTSISYIGMSISIVFLIITIITLIIFKQVRQRDVSKYHIQMSLAMLFMLIVSFVLVAMSAEGVVAVYGGCMTVSVLVHYFALVAVMWMGAEALLMFQKLVYVFYQITTKFIVAISVICWTVPLIFVAVPLITDLATGHEIKDDIIVQRASPTKDVSYCFLSHVGAFWGAFLAPIFIIMIFNIIIFIRVIIVMIRHTRDSAARQNQPVGKKTIIRLMISISGVMFLFGLTWLFAVFTFSVTGLKETFQILFVIFNSFQGLFLFFFICVLNKDVVESWRELISCGTYRSKLLHPSPIKPVAVKKYNTKSAGFTSSSMGKSTTETLKDSYSSSTLTSQSAFKTSGDVPSSVKVVAATTASSRVEVIQGANESMATNHENSSTISCHHEVDVRVDIHVHSVNDTLDDQIEEV